MEYKTISMMTFDELVYLIADWEKLGWQLETIRVIKRFDDLWYGNSWNNYPTAMLSKPTKEKVTCNKNI